MRQRGQKNSVDKARATGSRFLQSIEKQLTDHPQIGAVIIDGLVIACQRLVDMINKFEDELSERVEQLRQSKSETSPNKPESKGNRNQEESYQAH